MDVKQLQYFIAVAEHRSFSAAARALGIKQPSLSQQIARLEDAVGDALFDRMGNQIALTTVGRLMLPRAQAILAEVASLARSVREDVEQGKGQLAIGAIPTVAPYVVPAALEALRERFPNAEIVFREGVTAELIEAVARAEIEVALVASGIIDDRVTLQPLHSERLLLAMPTGTELSEQDRLCSSDLADVGVIVLNEVHCLGDQTRAFCQHAGILRQIRIEAGSLATAIECVRCGLGITLVPEMCAASTPEGIRLRNVCDVTPVRPLSAMWCAGRVRSPLAREFIALAGQVVPERLAAGACVV